MQCHRHNVKTLLVWSGAKSWFQSLWEGPWPFWPLGSARGLASGSELNGWPICQNPPPQCLGRKTCIWYAMHQGGGGVLGFQYLLIWSSFVSVGSSMWYLFFCDGTMSINSKKRYKNMTSHSQNPTLPYQNYLTAIIDLQQFGAQKWNKRI